MTTAYVAERGHGTSTSTLTTITISVATTTTANNKLICLVAGVNTSAGIGTITDTKGNTWTVDKSTLFATGDEWVLVISSDNATALVSGNTITIGLSGSCTRSAYWLEEFSGVSTGSSATLANSNQGAGATSINSGGSVAVNTAGYLSVGLFTGTAASTTQRITGINASGTVGTYSAFTTGIVEVGASAAFMDACAVYQANCTSAAQECAVTASTSLTDYQSCIVLYTPSPFAVSGTDTSSGTDSSSRMGVVLSPPVTLNPIGGMVLAEDQFGGTHPRSSTSVSGTDSSTAVESDTLVVNVSSSDSSTVVEASSLVVNMSSSDTGTGTEAGLISTGVTSSDTGTGTDITGPLVVKPVSTETGVGVDSGPAPPATLASSDASTGTDAATIAESSADGSSGTDSGTLVANVPGADSSTAVEGAKISLSSLDSSAVTEASTISANPSSTDSSTAVEGAKISVASSDSSTAVDASTVPPSHLAGSDTSTAVDTGAVPPATLTSADASAAIDAGAVPPAALSGADAATGVEGQPGIAFKSTDASAVVEASSVSNGISSADSSTATDGNGAMHVSVHSSDSVAAVETVSVFKDSTPPGRTYVVPYESRRLYVAEDVRTVLVDGDDRSLTVIAEVRTVRVDAEARILIAQGLAGN